MVKKISAVLLVFTCIFFAGCGSVNSIDPEKYHVSRPYYEGKERTLYLETSTITVTDAKVLDAGAKGNPEECPVILIYYEMHNYGEESFSAVRKLTSCVEVLKDYYLHEEDEEYIRRESANVQDETYSPVQDQYVSSKETKTFAEAYKLDSLDELVTLRFFSENSDEPLGVDNFIVDEIVEEGSNFVEAEPTPTPIPTEETTPEPVPELTPEKSESGQNETVTVGQHNALKSAQSYLDYSAFSYEGLIKQLEFEGYSNDEATYAADNCGADWNEQALKSAKSYLAYSAFSYTGLIEQLEFEGFTADQATYGADNCGADWNEQAAKSAESYLEYSSFSRDGLIEQLEFEGFTHEQAVYGVEANGY